MSTKLIFELIVSAFPEYPLLVNEKNKEEGLSLSSSGTTNLCSHKESAE